MGDAAAGAPAPARASASRETAMSARPENRIGSRVIFPPGCLKRNDTESRRALSGGRKRAHEALESLPENIRGRQQADDKECLEWEFVEIARLDEQVV